MLKCHENEIKKISSAKTLFYYSDEAGDDDVYGQKNRDFYKNRHIFFICRLIWLNFLPIDSLIDKEQ
jgi:hypothetical protein